MKPKKELLEAARRDGSWDRIDKVLSLAYLLQSKAYMLYDEADDLLRSHGLLIGRTKMLSNRVRKDYEDYFNDFKELMPDARRSGEYFSDLDDFSKRLHLWAGVPEDWKPGNETAGKEVRV